MENLMNLGKFNKTKKKQLIWQNFKYPVYPIAKLGQ